MDTLLKLQPYVMWAATILNILGLLASWHNFKKSNKLLVKYVDEIMTLEKVSADLKVQIMVLKAKNAHLQSEVDFYKGNYNG